MIPGGSSPRDIFPFLRLGLTSFGGPIAHLGYMRREFVERLRWLDERAFAQLVAITQFLPGPASSQLGFAVGLLRGGWPGAIAAFVAFTLPSAALLFAFALLLPRLGDAPLAQAAIHGLKLVALAVVAHGVVGMARRLTPDAPRVAIAAVAAALCLAVPSAAVQLLAVSVGAVAGLAVCWRVGPLEAAETFPTPRAIGPAWLPFVLFAALFAGLAVGGPRAGGLLALADGFYRAGALVFGGGHVVLPLLQETVVKPGWVSQGDFLAGYGMAQAVPGPMFSLAAHLGAVSGPSVGATAATGALVATLSIFVPGFLLIAGTLPLWGGLASRPGAARAIAGVNAAVVGILAAALYHPIWVSAVRGPWDVVVAASGFAALLAWNLSPLWIVGWSVAASVGAALFSAGASAAAH